MVKRNLVLGLILLAVTLLSYQPSWNGQPLWDDDAYMTRPELRSTAGLTRIWTQLGATPQYYPVVHTVFWLEHRLFGDATTGYHLLNILLHVFCALLLVRILRSLGIRGACLAGGIFALHPVMVESVAWITELKNTLSGVFFLSTALVYFKFDRERKKRLYALALGLFILGLVSKSVIATLPVTLLAVFWWKQGRIDWKRYGTPLLPFFVVGIASGLFTALVESKFSGAEGIDFNFTIIERCLIAGRAVWFYLCKLFLPADLIFIYPRWNVSQVVWWQYLYPFATLMLAGTLWSVRKRWRAPLAVFVCFTATIFPVMGFFNVYLFRFSFVADHFQYLACIGPIALTTAGLEWALGLLKWNQRRFPRPVLYVIVLLTLGVLTWKQSGIYADIEVLFRTTIQKNPDCWMAHNNLGYLLANTGRTDEAIAHFRKALEINPNYAEAHYNLGNILLQTGRTDEAIAHFRKALEINPNNTEAHNNLGNILLQTGRTDEAIAHYRKALEINPNNAQAHDNLGIALFQTGRTDEAISHFRKALEINPDNISLLNNLAHSFMQKGQLTDAIPFVKKALALAKASGDDSLIKVIAENLGELNLLCDSISRKPQQQSTAVK